MIKRYYPALAAQIYTHYLSNVVASFTGSTVTYTTVIKGVPFANVTFKVTTYSAASMSAVYQVNGTSYVLNDTFTLALDATGLLSITQFLDVGDMITGHGLFIVLTIFTVDKGLISGHNTMPNSKIV